ncbi:MAG TPA: EAL domain-containing protein [Xanthomonadaceae bacterium]|nr:EAL domain-containing protein [Xanthomonadaceae bacterium]
MNTPAAAAIRFVVLVALYVAGGHLATFFIESPDQVTLIWPPAGIAFGALIVYGPRWWPFIAVGVVTVHLGLESVPLLFVPYSAAGNVLGAVAGAVLARRAAPDLMHALTVRNGLVMLAAGLVMVSITAAIGVAGLAHSGMITMTAVPAAFAKWAMGDLFGLIVIAPSVLLVAAALEGPRQRLPIEYADWSEKAAWFAVMCLSLAAVLSIGGHSRPYAIGLASLPMGLLLWSALRFEPILTHLSTAVLAVFMTMVAGLGLVGFHPPGSLLESAILLAMMSVLAIVPQMLSTAMYENRVVNLRLLRRATTDPLTGFPNRQAFEHRMRDLVEHGDPSESMALAYLDLDQFKLVNDIASHAAGDELITALSSVLASLVDDHDTLARIGGDEFALLMRHTEAAAAARRAHVLREAVAGFRMARDGHVLTSTVSIGLVPFRPVDVDFADLLAQADAACFTAKERGGNRVEIVSLEGSRMEDRTAAMRWAMRLSHALEHQHFELFCQSIVPLGADALPGLHFEVLLRMRDAETGELMLPTQFVPAAERFKLGARLDRYVLDHTLRWLENNPGHAARISLCSINLTAAAVESGEFAGFLRRRLADSPIAPEMLCFELTETSAVRELARAQNFIQSVRSMGCRFALDDFGTGFCSFAYLHALDVDYYKIDGSFVREIESSRTSLAIVRAIADIGRVMEKRTIAEYVETEAIRARCAELGVDYVQGFAIDEPMPIDAYFARADATTRQTG